MSRPDAPGPAAAGGVNALVDMPVRRVGLRGAGSPGAGSGRLLAPERKGST